MPEIGGAWYLAFMERYPVGAKNAYSPNYDIPYWPVVSLPLPGDLAALSGHLGIVTDVEYLDILEIPLNDGLKIKGLTISAAITKGVVENNWGFRPKTPGHTVFRRCSCSKM